MKNNQAISIALTVVIASLAVIGGVYAWESLITKSSNTSGNGSKESDTQASPSAKNKVEEYIKNNISELSPEDAVLGGTFHVTSINFVGPDTCMVDYEDGHIALTAEAEFEIDQQGKVEINSFELIEDTKRGGEQINFQEIGNLTKRNGNWHLIYEMPGKPALDLKLTFTKESECLDETEDNSCTPVYWNVGDRAQITGVEEGKDLRVTTLRIVGEAGKNISGGKNIDINSFMECVNAGHEVLYPDCEGCAPYCETPEGTRFEKQTESNDHICEDRCGNGICEETVCMGEGCPCAETSSSCPRDCQ